MVPLIAAAVSVPATGPVFEGALVFRLSGGTAGENIAPYREQLVACAWESAPGLPGATDWTVAADIANRELRLALRGPHLSDLPGSLSRFAETFRNRLEDSARRDAALAEARRQPLLHERDELRAALAETPAPPEGASPGEKHAPFDQLMAQCDAVDSRAQQVRQMRAELLDLLGQRDRLRHAPLPSAAVVDPADRHRAYAANTVLQQDLRQLEVQLALVRSAMLQVWQRASGSLDDVLASASAMGRISDAPEVAALPAERRALLERIAEGAADHHRLTVRFAQDWTRSFLAVQALDMDPADPKVLTMYEQVGQLVGDYLHAASASLTRINPRIRALAEQSEDEARSHVLTALTARQFHELQAAQRRFTDTASELLSRDNYLLDSALQSARGLAFRSRSVRNALDAGLEDDARRRAQEERLQRIDELSARIDALQGRIDEHVGTLLADFAAFHRNTQRLPELIEADAARQLSRERREWRIARLERIENQLAAVSTSAAPASLDPHALQLARTELDDLPANLTALLTTAALAWGIAFFALLALGRRTIVAPAGRAAA